VQPERSEQALAQGRLPGAAGGSGHHLAQQGVGEVGVVPAAARRQHLAGLLETGQQPVAVGVLQRLPDLATWPADRLPL
jgi:hypothetical protein